VFRDAALDDHAGLKTRKLLVASLCDVVVAAVLFRGARVYALLFVTKRVENKLFLSRGLLGG